MEITKHIWYSGHVQGVCFRAQTTDVAKSFAVRGYVENLSDGSVHIHVKGEASVVEDFLTKVEQTMAGHITNRQDQDSHETISEPNFTIRYT
ncbi:MAG: acylphosphatase [Pseudomonadota bacterium]|nr:acylphosphatase [Pseudomonadota bacterium]MEC8977401.1 acylphosphatase [Pseudomonadota bacterium]